MPRYWVDNGFKPFSLYYVLPFINISPIGWPKETYQGGPQMSTSQRPVHYYEGALVSNSYSRKTSGTNV